MTWVRISGPEDFKPGRKISCGEGSTSYYEVLACDGLSLDSVVTVRFQRTKFYRKYVPGRTQGLNYYIRDFGKLSGWYYEVIEYQYDPNQQGDTEDDI